MNSKALLPLLLAVLLSCAGARAAAPVVVTHLADGNKTVLTVRITQEIKILLPAPTDAAPGFEWQILSNDSRILRLIHSPKAVTATDKPAADKSPAPAAGTWTTSFLALRPGRSTVRLVYTRAANNGEVTAADSREIVITVNQ